MIAILMYFTAMMAGVQGFSSIVGGRSMLRKYGGKTLHATSTTPEDIAKSWEKYFEKNHQTRYQIIAGPGFEEMAEKIVNLYPERFMFHKTKWGKFPDGTDNIEIGGFQPVNKISGEHVLMLASFHNNDVTLSQFSVMVTLLQSFVETLSVCLPFYPVGTMERVTQEGYCEYICPIVLKFTIMWQTHSCHYV